MLLRPRRTSDRASTRWPSRSSSTSTSRWSRPTSCRCASKARAVTCLRTAPISRHAWHARSWATTGSAITVRSEIPVGRGLGSSASLAVATAAACGADDPLTLAARLDGHPENAGASVLGGLVAAADVSGHPVTVRLPLDRGLAFVVLVPSRPARDRAGPSGAARAGAPGRGRVQPRAPRSAARGPRRPAAAREGGHRGPPAPGGRGRSLFPQSGHLLAGLVDAGALASCWSGAGPSLLGICTVEAAPRVRAAGDELLAGAGVPGRALLLKPDLEGLAVEDPSLPARAPSD